MGEQVLIGTEAKPLLLRWQAGQQSTGPIIIFLHGFKGFMDWGHWPLVRNHLAEDSAAVVAYNITHGGTSPAYPTEFVDLEAFGHNTIEKELFDLKSVLEWVKIELASQPSSSRPVVLLGHSRGGGIALLGAARFAGIGAVVTWNGVSDFGMRFAPHWISAWERGQTVWVPNMRTGQQMPLFADAWLEYSADPDQYDVGAALQAFCNASPSKKVLVVQGAEDETVPLAEGQYLASLHPSVRYAEIPNGNHTFGGSHPWPLDSPLPAPTLAALVATRQFLTELSSTVLD